MDTKYIEILEQIYQTGYSAHLVGGAVRDFLLGNIPKDYDIFTNAPKEQLKQLFPDYVQIGGSERKDKMFTIVKDDIEISQYRKGGERTQNSETLSEHLSTCDYNVNAIALDLGGNIIDPYKGEESLRQGTFRFVGDGNRRIEEDPLRILRALKLDLLYNLNPTKLTKDIIRKNRKKLKKVAKERIRGELLQLLKSDKLIETLNTYYLLVIIMDDIYLLQGLDAGPHHNEKDVYHHTQLCYKNICKITEDPLLRLSAIFHDSGKFTTMKIIEGKPTFYRHEKESENIVREWMNKYKFSNDEIRYVSTLVKHHMLSNIEEMKKKTLINIFEDLNKNNVYITDLVTLLYADNQANLKKKRKYFHEYLRNNKLIKSYYKAYYNRTPFNINDLEISGRDLINLGYKEGPMIGEILRDLRDRVLLGDLINRKDRLLEALKDG